MGRFLTGLITATSVGLLLSATSTGARAGDEPDVESLPPQTILPPGLYLFQTRTRNGTCDDAPRTGYVTSAVATLDGVPGARTMNLRVLNSKWWPVWKLQVQQDDTLVGSATMFGAKDPDKGTSRFEIRPVKDRFQGTGAREYPGRKDKSKRCTLYYDALLKPID